MRSRKCQVKHYTLNDDQREIVEQNYKLVRYTIDKYFHINPRHMEDIMQVGAIGLCRAAYEYDSSVECSFASFAIRCIRTSIHHYYDYLYRKKRDMQNECLVLDKMINLTDREPIRLVDMLPDEGADVEEDVNSRLYLDFLHEQMEKSGLKDRERTVLERVADGERMSQIAKDLGVTRSRVGAIFHMAQVKARKCLEGCDE